MIKPRILLIDHNDSFTYNLVHLFNETGLCKTEVTNYQEIALEQINDFDKIVLGPGPGLPKEYPHFQEVIDKFKNTKSILGICLGHQAIGQYFGAKLLHLPQVLHGQKILVIYKENSELFHGIKNPFNAGLYHSWVLDGQNLPKWLIPLAFTGNNHLMAFRYRNLNITGLQFHPESYMTPEGKKMIENWISL